MTNNVPRETILILNQFVKQLLEWNEKINLIGQSTVGNIWERHIEDSAQLSNLIPDPDIKLIDIGSGAGFPGLVLSYLGVREVHLVESDRRKIEFLIEVAKLSPNKIIVHHLRSEQMAVIKSDLITARAVAPLDKLFTLTEHLIANSKQSLFMKGAKHQEEIAAAEKKWKFDYQLHTSLTNTDAKIIAVQNLRIKKGSKAK